MQKEVNSITAKTLIDFAKPMTIKCLGDASLKISFENQIIFIDSGTALPLRSVLKTLVLAPFDDHRDGIMLCYEVKLIDYDVLSLLRCPFELEFGDTVNGELWGISDGAISLLSTIETILSFVSRLRRRR
jgi:hypothetical protein